MLGSNASHGILAATISCEGRMVLMVLTILNIASHGTCKMNIQY